MKTKIKASSEKQQDAQVTAMRALFDNEFYLRNNPDVKKSKLDPFTHYLEHGAKERRSPHPLFDCSYYFDMAPNPKEIGDNPLLHFLTIGHQQRFNPHPLFDLVYYRQQTQIGEQNPLLHFLSYGKELQLNPHPLFDTRFYLAKYLDAKKSKLNPLLHFLRYGRLRQSHPLFDPQFYLSRNADIRKSSINPLVHFVWRGARERRWPNAKFDPLYYLKTIWPASFDNPLLHYLEIGQNQGLDTHASHNLGIWQRLETVFCFMAFPFLSLQYAYLHSDRPFKFWRLAVSRFLQGYGREVVFSRPNYLTQPKRLVLQQPYAWRVLQSPILFAYLYLADVFKVQGFFADAENILRKLCKQTSIQDLALASLGDLLLVQATWASEFKQYEKDGITINPFQSATDIWHNKGFDEALNVLEQAIDKNSQNAGIQWLLGYGYLVSGKYDLALKTIQKYSGQETAAQNLLKAQAAYGLNPSDGVAVRRQYLGVWSQTCNISHLNQISVSDLSSTIANDHQCIVKPIKQLIESVVIRNLELTSFKNTLTFTGSYLTRFKNVQIIPQCGLLVVDNKTLIKESAHMKSLHMPVYSSYIKEVCDDSAFLCAPESKLFAEENCIYIGHHNNYYHWLIDELPRLSLIEQSGLFDNAPILADQNILPWQYEALSMLGIEQERLRHVNFSQATAFINLIVPSRLSRDWVAHPQAVSFMRQKLLANAYDLQSKKGKRIYVTRTVDGPTRRMMLNEKNVIDKFKRNNFQIVDPSVLSIKQQIELFGDAEIIAGPVGAGLTNILFAPKQAKLISLGPDQFIWETYTSLACAIGQTAWSIRGVSFSRPYPHAIWTNFDYEISEKDIDLCFDRVID